MDPSAPSTPSTKPTHRNRFSLILQLGSPSAESSDHAIKSKRSMPNFGEAYQSSPGETKSSGYSTPKDKSRHRSSTISPATFSAFLRQMTGSSPSDGLASPKETEAELVKASPKKIRGLSEVLNQITTSDPISLEVDDDDMDVAPQLAAVKEMPSPRPVPSPRRKLTRSASTSHAQKVKSYVKPRPLPPIVASRPKPPRYERVDSESSTMKSVSPSTSSFHTAKASTSTAPSPAPTLPDRNPLPETSSNPDSSTLPTPTTTPKTRRNAALKQKRRMSFDFSALTQSPVSAPSSPTRPPRNGVKRSRSLWAQKSDLDDSVAGNVHKRAGTPGPMTEKQRALNIKRARKMAQLFGSDPPSALYQITNLDNEGMGEDDDEGLTPVERHRRESLATIVSLAPLSTSSIHRRSASMSSLAVLTDNIEHNKSADPKMNRPGTPPPPMPRADSETVSNDSNPAFRARRRRAAKLAQFFGVGYHDLSASMLLPLKSSSSPPPPPPPLPTEFTGSRPNLSMAPPNPPASVEVDVKMSAPTRGFWGIMDGRRNVKDANMDDVIGTLRGMKAR